MQRAYVQLNPLENRQFAGTFQPQSVELCVISLNKLTFGFATFQIVNLLTRSQKEAKY